MREAVFFNVWRTESEEAKEALLEAMRNEAPDLQAKPGFLCLTAWAGQTGDNRVVVEGRWESQDAFDKAVTNNPSTPGSRHRLAAFGTPEPGLFGQAFRFDAPSLAESSAGNEVMPNRPPDWRTTQGRTAEISADLSRLTFIQVWSMELEDHQQRWLAIMHERIGLLTRQPGFLSMSLHASLDGKQTAVYAQWKDEASLTAAVSLPEARQSHDDMAKWGNPIAAAVYTVESVYLPLSGAAYHKRGI